jgi:outer membrane protein assembly factor BamB
MRRFIMRAYAVVAAGVVLGIAAVSGASASAAAPRAARVFSAAVSHAAPSPGTQLWVSRYHGPTGSNNAAASVAVSPTGNAVFVTGESEEAGGVTFTFATAAYNATTGAQLWAKRHSAGFDTVDIANAVAVSPDGGTVFVTGVGTRGYATVAYDASTGAQLWVKNYRTGSVAYSVAVSPTGNEVFVAGSVGDGRGYATVAYNAATGAQLWAKRYIGPAVGAQANSVAVSPSGGTVFVTGYSDGTSSGEDYATVAYNAATGAQLWAKRYTGPGNNTDDAHSVAVSPDSKTVFVAGESSASALTEDYATIAYNAATGAQLWVKRYGGTGNTVARAYSVAVSPTGKTVFVTGNDGFISWTVAYSAATGTQSWAKAYSGTSPGGGGAMSAGVSPDGTKVYITGFVSDVGKGGYGTVAYNAVTGTQVWAKKYFGPRGQTSAVSAIDLAVSPVSGTVFVTGSNVSVTDAFYDYATVAYQG